ncbi:MAG: hypothetical protein K9L59_10250 [Desulfobacterales bacterium]|nr:hypothetical protein [Desulfobacterales bacterium]
MTSYNREQLEALRMVRRQLASMGEEGLAALRKRIDRYLAFRNDLEEFLRVRFGDICNEKCFCSRLSACCTREGIIVFFADVVVNALASSPQQLDAVEQVFEYGHCGRDQGFKCVFLTQSGCLWQVRPIVCAMFLCDSAKEKVFGQDPEAARQWAEFENRRKAFTWPDKPVLFDDLETVFMEAGCRSPLMHLHFSPGLRMVKKKQKH